MTFKQVIGIILILALFILGADTKIDLQSRTKNPNFSGMTGTYSAQTGTSLPVTCGVGQTYFKTNVTAGSNWFGCTATNTWTLLGGGSGGGGIVTWQTDGSQSALEQTANFKSGTGILVTGSNPSGKYQVQFDYDPTTLSSIDSIQSGAPVYIRSTTGNDTYTGCPAHSITGYTRGMVVFLDPDTVNTGAATLNLCVIGAKSILTRSGGALSDADITANKVIALSYDGTQFDIVGDGGGATLTAAEPIAVVSNVISYAFRPATFYIFDEFLSGYDFGASKPKGQLGWQVFTTAGNCVIPASLTGWPGVMQLQTGTSNNDNCGVALDGSLSFVTVTVAAPGSITWHTQTIVHTDTSAVTNYMFELGWSSAQGYRSTNSIAVRFDTTSQTCTTGSNSTTDFVLETISGGSSNCVVLGATVAANTTYILDLSGASGVITAKYSTNNGSSFSSPVTSSTNVPSAALFPKMMVQTRTTAAKYLYIDRYELLETGLTRP